MLSINSELLRHYIGHAVDLQRYANGVVRSIIGLLNQSDGDLLEQLRLVLSRLNPSAFTVQRLDQMLDSTHRITALAMQEVGQELSAEMRRFVEYESDYQASLLRRVLPQSVIASIGVNAPNVEQIYTAVTSNPLQGRLLSEWNVDMSARRQKLVRDALRQGYVQQQTTEQMIQRIRGTKISAYTDGVLEVSRREARTLVYSATQHAASVTRAQVVEDNKDLVKRVRWIATLDNRTSNICRMRDGKEYNASTYRPIGHSLPWLGGPGNAHWNCRSLSVPVLKSWRELGIDLDEMKPSERVSMDGMVPGDLTYGQWLLEQSAARQDEILGPTRGALLRKGGMEFEQFANRKGEWLTLAELRRRHASAFRKANL